MKSRILALALLLTLTSAGLAYASSSSSSACNTNKCCKSCSRPTSKTFFSVRPQFGVGTPEFQGTLRQLEIMEHKNDHWYFSATVFGGESTEEDRLGRYFSPFDSECICVDGCITEGGTALLPQHFNIQSVKFSEPIATNIGLSSQNIDSAFKSCITLQPKQSVIGVGLSGLVRFDLGDWNFWLSVSAPIQQVENTMGLCERVTQTGDRYEVPVIDGETTNLDCPQQNMAQALQQKQWCFGKIDNCKHDETTIAFVEVLLGLKWIDDAECHGRSAFGITIPTGNDPDGHYVFEPIVGNNGHFGFTTQTSFGIELLRKLEKNWSLSFEYDITAQYLFESTQRRSLDLKYKPWSRYMELYKNLAQATQAQTVGGLAGIFLNSPGINTLTQCVRVKPGINLTSNVAVLFQQEKDGNGFNAELGYNFHIRRKECVSLRKKCAFTEAIKDHTGLGLTNPARDMTNDLLSNEAARCNAMINGLTNQEILDLYPARTLNECDLDLNSAAHPCSLSHTPYLTLGYRWNELATPINLEISGSYEISNSTNPALERWMLWGRVGIQF